MDFELPAGTGAKPGNQDFKALVAEARAARKATQEQERAEATAKQAELAARFANTPAERKTKQRAETRKRVAAFRKRHDAARLRESQQAALAALPESERKRLTDQAEDCDLLTFAMTRTSEAISKGLAPSFDPISLYGDVKDFVSEYGLATDWLPGIDFLARMDAEDQDDFSDREYVQYGLCSRIFSTFFQEFIRVLAVWLANHPCDAAVKTQIETLAKQHDNTPPVHEQTVGYSQIALDQRRNAREEGERILADWAAQRARQEMHETNKSRGMEFINEQPSV